MERRLRKTFSHLARVTDSRPQQRIKNTTLINKKKKEKKRFHDTEELKSAIFFFNFRWVINN